MKRLLMAFLFVPSLAGAVSQPNAMGEISASSATFSGGVALWNLPAARFLTLTPKTTGQMILCSNCQVPYTICIATGSTAAYQWILSTGTACK